MSLWLPISSLGSCVVGLYDDARFPGRCLLVLKEHFDHLEDIDPALMSDVMSDLRKVASALKAVTGAPRLNYAVLGNAEPHVHWHIIPRHPSTEPSPTRSPWDDPRPRVTLPHDLRDIYLAKIAAALSTDES